MQTVEENMMTQFSQVEEEETKENVGEVPMNNDDGDVNQANINPHDSILFNEALLRDEDEEVRRIFVGNPKK